MQVYLSHTEIDQPLADEIRKALTDAGLEVWDAGRELLPGDNFAQKIADALKSSKAMVVLITPEAIASEWLKREVGYALGSPAYANRVFPVLARDPDNQLSEQMPWILRRFPTTRLTAKDTPRKKIQQVVKALKQGAHGSR